jgi:hypothetical protein
MLSDFNRSLLAIKETVLKFEDSSLINMDKLNGIFDLSSLIVILILFFKLTLLIYLIFFKAKCQNAVTS